MVGVSGGIHRPAEVLVKRLLDIVISLLALVGLAPLLGIISGAVRAKMGLPILFRQERPGIRGRLFVLHKFRTMSEIGTEPDMQPVSDASRLTPLGGVLRRWSLDELPELWNVLKGEMSLVGPRPLLRQYLPLYSQEQARRHEVKPGITGLAQILGRNDTTWDRRLELDVWYVDHWTIWLDLRILAMTVERVLGGRGVSAKGHATMPQFEGSTSA